MAGSSHVGNTFIVVTVPYAGRVGITLEATPPAAARLGNALVTRVVPHTSAANSGVRKGDVLIGIGARMVAFDPLDTTIASLKDSHRSSYLTFSRAHPHPRGRDAARSSTVVLSRGVCQKKSKGLFGAWKGRYFHVELRRIIWADDEAAVQRSPKHDVPISEVSSWSASSSGDKYWEFSRGTVQFTLFLGDACERVQWLYAIDQAKRCGTESMHFHDAAAVLDDISRGGAVAGAGAGAGAGSGGGSGPVDGWAVPPAGGAPPLYPSIDGSGAGGGMGSAPPGPPLLRPERSRGGDVDEPRRRGSDVGNSFGRSTSSSRSRVWGVDRAGGGRPPSGAPPAYSATKAEGLQDGYAPLQFTQMRLHLGDGALPSGDTMGDEMLRENPMPSPDAATAIDFSLEYTVIAKVARQDSGRSLRK